MATHLNSTQRSLLATAAVALLSMQIPSCAGDDPSPSHHGDVVSSDGGTPASSSLRGGTASVGGAVSQSVGTTSSESPPVSGGTGQGGASTSRVESALTLGGSAASLATGGSSTVAGGTAAKPAAGGAATSSASTPSTGGSRATAAGVGGSVPVATGGASATGNGQYVVSLLQASKANASDLTDDDVKSLVTDAITQAGGLDFIHDGMTVVLKPNLLTHLAGCWSGSATLPPSVNGVTSDWRVTKTVADLVRAKNPTGKILVMEGSTRNTTAAFAALGYTSSNFGSAVDEFIPLEGSGCTSRSSDDLVQKAGKSGKQYWVNRRYLEADIVISIGAMKTHFQAGMTGCVKNLGIGATPNAMYSVSNSDADCTRNFRQSSSTSTFIDHSFAGLGSFVSDFYSIRPADFAILDGLQGLQNGPCSSDAKDRMNMRLILASKNAVALDTVQTAIMNCSGSKVPYLTKLESWGLGTTDLTKISVVGNKQIADVKKSFAGAAGGICQ